MVQADLSSVEYILPLLSFLLVFLVCLFLIKKAKMIENLWVEIFVSFAIAAIFVAAAGPRNLILTVIPWFAILVIGLFLVMAIGGFIGQKDFPSKGIGIAFIVLLAIIFIIAALFVFSKYIGPYIPGNTGLSGNPGNPALLGFFGWLYSPAVIGAILLIGVSAAAAWVVTKKG